MQSIFTLTSIIKGSVVGLPLRTLRLVIKLGAGVFGKTGWRITINCNDKDSIAHFSDSASTCSDVEAELLYVGVIGNVQAHG